MGNGSHAVVAAINEREARLRAITDKLIEPGEGSLQEKLDELRTFALERLTKLRARFCVHEARSLLAEQVGKLTLERVSDGSGSAYRAMARSISSERKPLHAWVVPGERHARFCHELTSLWRWPHEACYCNLAGSLRIDSET